MVNVKVGYSFNHVIVTDIMSFEWLSLRCARDVRNAVGICYVINMELYILNFGEI